MTQLLSPFPGPVTVNRATGGKIVTRIIWLMATLRYRAVIWTSWDSATVVVSIVKLAVFEPAATVTVATAGRAPSLFDVDKPTVPPPLGAAVVSVTVPVADCCDCTFAGEIVNDE